MPDMSQRLLRLAMNRSLPSGQLGAIARLRVILDEEEREAVTKLRQMGTTWDAIGTMLGVSRQAVQKRFK